MINEQELDAKLRNEEMIFFTCSVSERWNVLLLVMNVTNHFLIGPTDTLSLHTDSLKNTPPSSGAELGK